MIADKAYDSNAMRAIIAGIGVKAVIPSNRSRKRQHSARHGALQRAQPHRALLQPVSSTSDASPPAMTAAPATSSPSSASPQP